VAVSRIAASLNQTGTLSAPSTQDKFGKTSYGAATTVPCRVEKVTKNIVTKQNELTPIHAFAMFDNNVTIAIGYKFIHSGATYKIVALEAGVNRFGETTHYEASLQEWNL